MWGFWGSIFQITILATLLPLAFIVNKNSSAVLNMTGMILQIMSCCSGAAWFLLGFFWRFSRAGRTASGEKLERLAGVSDEVWKQARESAQKSDGYQLNSGCFISVFLWITLFVLLFTVLAGTLSAVLCCCSKQQDEKLLNNKERDGDKNISYDNKSDSMG